MSYIITQFKINIFDQLEGWKIPLLGKTASACNSLGRFEVMTVPKWIWLELSDEKNIATTRWRVREKLQKHTYRTVVYNQTINKKINCYKKNGNIPTVVNHYYRKYQNFRCFAISATSRLGSVYLICIFVWLLPLRPSSGERHYFCSYSPFLAQQVAFV